MPPGEGTRVDNYQRPLTGSAMPRHAVWYERGRSATNRFTRPTTLLVSLAMALPIMVPIASGDGSSGASSFDYITATDAPLVGAAEPTPLTEAELAEAVGSAEAEWLAAVPSADMSGVEVTIVDLPELGLGRTVGTSIEIDPTAAGHGWDVLDLGTVVRHELGHVLGFEHTDDEGLMEELLAPGETHGVPTANSFVADSQATVLASTEPAASVERASESTEPAAIESTNADSANAESVESESTVTKPGETSPTAL